MTAVSSRSADSILFGQHLSEAEYHEVVQQVTSHGESRRMRGMAARRFRERWPDLHDWMAQPLPIRLNHPSPQSNQHAFLLAGFERHYLCALAMRGRVLLGWDWLLGQHMRDLFRGGGIPLGLGPSWLAPLEEEAVRIGYSRMPARGMLQRTACGWPCDWAPRTGRRSPPGT